MQTSSQKLATWLAAVNVLFMDQWDYWDAILEGHSAWEMFRWRHGPHRQEVGNLVTALVAHYSSWNVRAEAFVIGGMTATYRLTEKIELADSTSRFPIYPDPERTRLQEKLRYLKEHRLNFYSDEQ